MGDTYPRFTVAAVQAASVLFDRDKTVDKAIHFIEEAADKGAVIIGFPEGFIPGFTNVWYHAKDTNPLRSQATMQASPSTASSGRCRRGLTRSLFACAVSPAATARCSSRSVRRRNSPPAST